MIGALMRWRAAAPLLVVALLVSGCSIDTLDVVRTSDAAAQAEAPAVAFDRGDRDRADRGERRNPDPAPTSSTRDGIKIAGHDPQLERPDGMCLPDGEALEVDHVVAYQVVDGTLGTVCFGEPDPIVEQSWAVLADLTPPGQLHDLGLFAGFDSATDTEATTLAFVQRLNEDGTEFMMAVNIAETEADPDEATLTLAHEFTHVFTAGLSELDPYVMPGECPTFDNGEGCYVADSIINQWYEQFWADAPGDPTIEADADQRCDLDSGYFGQYAASTPEEDFAEAFSAYVLQVKARTPGQQQRLDFIDAYPGLAEFRDRAIALGYGPLANTFDTCG